MLLYSLLCAVSLFGNHTAFPVLTLAMEVAPGVARDFSYMIQSVGMTAAAFSIFFMRVLLEWHAIIYASVGGVAGVIYGLEKVAPLLEPAYTKMYFVCIWFAFAFALFWINRYRDREVYHSIPFWKEGEMFRYSLGTQVFGKDIAFVINWRAFVLVGTGFLGGIFSAMSGSGIDICSFAVLALLFRVSERVATPTSVILMAVNTVVAFMYRKYSVESQTELSPIAEEAYNLWYVCIPVVVIGAPLGAVVSSHLHRTVLAYMIYVIDLAQLIGALYVVRPWTTEKTDTPVDLCITSAIILVSGCAFFSMLAVAGQNVLKMHNQEDQEEGYSSVSVVGGEFQGLEQQEHLSTVVKDKDAGLTTASESTPDASVSDGAAVEMVSVNLTPVADSEGADSVSV